MPTVCLSKNVSYATWRLQVFSRLWVEGTNQHDGILNLRPSWTDTRNEKRERFHTTSTRYKDGRGPNTHQNTRRASALIRQVGARRRLMQRGQLKKSASFAGSNGEETEGEASQSMSSSKSYAESKEPYKPRITPFGAAGAGEDLKNVHDFMPWLLGNKVDTKENSGSSIDSEDPQTKSHLEELLDEIESLTKVPDKGHNLRELAQAALMEGQSFIPVSPVEKKFLKKGGIVRWKVTPKQPGVRNPILAQNSWATMLSDSIRQCGATRARLPRKLMSSWGLIRNPGNFKDYLTPIEASDLQGFKDSMAYVENENPQDKRSRSPRVPAGERVLLQPNAVLFEALSDEVGRDHQSSARTIGNWLIPWRWKLNQDKVNAYARTQKQPDGTGEGSSSVVTGKEIGRPSYAPNLNALRWMPDTTARFRAISNTRLLIALEGLAVNNSTSNALRRRKVTAMELPEDGIIEIAGRKETRGGKEQSDQDADEEASEFRSSAAIWQPGSIFLHIGSPNKYARTIEKWRLQAQSGQSGAKDPSIILPPLKDDPLIPPTVTVINKSEPGDGPSVVRAPIYNLHSLLGSAYEEHIQRLQNTLYNFGVFDLRYWTDLHEARKSHETSRRGTTNSNSDIDKSNKFRPIEPGAYRDADTEENSDNTSIIDKEYMVLIKRTAGKSMEFADEVWQLWRYLGGRNGLYLGDDEDHSHSNDGDESNLIQRKGEEGRGEGLEEVRNESKRSS